MADENEGNVTTDPAANGADNGTSVWCYFSNIQRIFRSKIRMRQMYISGKFSRRSMCSSTLAPTRCPRKFTKLNSKSKSLRRLIRVSPLSWSCYIAGCSVCAMYPMIRRIRFLFAEAPRMLFPFARAIISDAVRDAGFQPLMLEPIDFTALYLQQREAQAAAEGASEGEQPVGNA